MATMGQTDNRMAARPRSNDDNGSGSGSEAKPRTFLVHTSLMFDSQHKEFLEDVTLTVDSTTGLIVSSQQRTSPLTAAAIRATDVDLRGAGRTVLPGLVDAHTHILLHAYEETPSLYQMRDESLAERTLRAANHCRTALRAGYTTYRDLGTEGAGEMDIGIRDAINRGLVPGPRLFVATEALASSGSYEVRVENRPPLGTGTRVPRISDPCDGVDGCTAAVRRRIGAGADVIKFYADYRRRTLRFPVQNWPGCCPVLQPPVGEIGVMDPRNVTTLLFKQDEMDAIVAEARRALAPVAAHASTPEAVMMAARAGVTTIEHGTLPSIEALEVMKEMGTIFVPTLTVMEWEKGDKGGAWFAQIMENVFSAWKMGVRLACGGDIGAVAHGENARELELMAMTGIPVEDVLRAATLGGWEACGGDLCGRRFGWLGEGWSADLVVVEGDMRKDGIERVIRKVDYVMKDGKAVVVDGKIVE